MFIASECSTQKILVVLSCSYR